MKKVYSIIAILTLIVCAASCGNKKAKEPAPAPKTEQPAANAKEKSAEDEIKDAAKAAAVDVAKTGINAAADAAKKEMEKKK